MRGRCQTLTIRDDALVGTEHGEPQLALGEHARVARVGAIRRGYAICASVTTTASPTHR